MTATTTARVCRCPRLDATGRMWVSTTGRSPVIGRACASTRTSVDSGLEIALGFLSFKFTHSGAL